MDFIIDPKFILYETHYWRVNHRVDTGFPGYLMLAPKDPNATAIDALPSEGISELGRVLAKTLRVLDEALHPERTYVNRYNHTPGFNIHFHIIPLYTWVKDLFLRDMRYQTLRQFYNPQFGTDPDGHDLTLYIVREFCENPHPPKPPGMTVEEILPLLQNRMNAPDHGQ